MHKYPLCRSLRTDKQRKTTIWAKDKPLAWDVIVPITFAALHIQNTALVRSHSQPSRNT